MAVALSEQTEGIPNEIATKLVLMIMGFIITMIFLCIFLVIAVCIYYKGKSEEFLFMDKKSSKIEKDHSPYIITPEQKITQQMLTAQMVTPIECSVNDIARLLRYIALYGEFTEDEIYRTPKDFIHLVTRGKTKFDIEDESKKEHKVMPKLGSQLHLPSDQENHFSILRMQQQQDISSFKPRKKARRKELYDEMDRESGVKGSSKKGRLAVSNSILGNAN
ncbi:unnamed protein product [Cercopithifilaria johnstoni]|uniref:Uncharacterized protein n=1 Tax=Cercopithifilaria johnstoni TaxID=2874296 RepID=A0A8J2LXC7_9BILA|nr:unnamed protein product [Cercopithifilaria johnstoni]